MKLNRIADMAKQAIDKRGGIDALKQDLNEVKDVARGKGSLREKARAAAEAMKQPGSGGAAEQPQATTPPVDTPPQPAPAPDAPPEPRVHPDPQAPDAA
ncbi:MAG: hypothetical protein JWQ48_4191 [Conexibacter sp.]|nr:hypothetical protein [Conexibacter sp.]